MAVKFYRAPWGTSLVVTSILTAALCLTLPWVFAFSQGPGKWLACALPLVPALSALFTIRGYGITDEAILIRRLLWTTRLPRTGLRVAEALPNAMSRSLRLCGNGGLFSFTGWYRKKTLGVYRAWVTDLRSTVILRFEKRAVVLSPADPNAFIRDLALVRSA